jgi:hypothetical protein
MLNPKPDREGMEKIIRKYIAEMSSGQTPTTPFV